MEYIDKAKELEEDFNFQRTYEDYWKEECWIDLIEKIVKLRNRIIVVSIMKNYKTKKDEEAVRILDNLLKLNSERVDE